MTKPTYRRAISLVLAAAMIPYSIGCYSYSRMVSPENSSAIGSEDIVLVLNSGQRYKIFAPWELDQNGNLIGKGRDMAASVNTPNSVQSIPMDEIQIIREKELDGIKTIIMAGVGLLIIGLIVWDLSQPGWMGGPMI